MQGSTTDISLLSDEMLQEIARDCLLPRTNRYEIREFPHSNQVDFQLLSVDKRGRAAILEILRREILYIEVTYHECVHRMNLDPRTIGERRRRSLGEGTHPSLEDVFGVAVTHPALCLKRAGHTVHTIQLNIRCPRLCQNSRAHIVAFVPAETRHILALSPAIQRLQRPIAHLDVGFVEMITAGIATNFPMIRPQVRAAVDLIQNIHPGVYHGIMTPASILETGRDLVEYFSGEIDQFSWPKIEPFYRRYLAELEGLIASGTPVHELAGLVENFLSGKIFPNFGEYGQNDGLDNATFLSIFSMFNRYQCIFMDGLAEYLLRREATADGQSHHVLDAICPEVHYLWCHFNQTMGTNAMWAKRVTNDWLNPQDSIKPCEESLSLFLQCAATRLSEIRLRFAMARARRANPKLRCYQELCVISRMASNSWDEREATSQQTDNCTYMIRGLTAKMEQLTRTYRVSTPELVDMRAKAEELLALIVGQTATFAYLLHDWNCGPGLFFNKRPLLTLPIRPYEILQVEPTAEVMTLLDQMRNQRDLFTPVAPY